jgi:Pectate lyase superfamily protein
MIDVTTCGACGDGSTDDTEAINAALQAGDNEVYFPSGTYCISGSLRIPHKPIHLRGAGQEVASIKSTGSGYPALVGDYSGWSRYTGAMPVTITGLTIATTVNNPWPAIAITYYDLGVGASVIEETVVIRDVLVRPDVSGAPVSFGAGIALESCWNAVIDNVVIHGNNVVSAMTQGIRLGGNSLDVNISNFRITNAQTGIEINDRCEGTLIHHGWIIANEGVTNGIVASTRPGTPGEPNKPWLSVNDCHISASQWGVFLNNHPQCSLANNLIYKWGSKAFRGIWIEGSALGGGGHTSIVGNKLFNNGTGPADGIVLNVPFCTVTGNITSNIPRTAVWLAPSAKRCVVTGNAIPAADIYNVGLGNVVANNL